MKIVLTDNYGRSGESPSGDERVIVSGVNESWGKIIVALLRNSAGRIDTHWFDLVDDDYVLKVFEP